MPDTPSRVVVIGASAGGVEALRQLVSQLPPDFQAAVLVVLHVLASGESYLPGILSRAGPLRAFHAATGERIRPGHIFTAIPDHHLALQDGRLRVVRGPTQNRHRPSIDVLFRSAAHAYGNKVIGVLLTGSDDDGAAGVKDIRRHGGKVIVQDPADSLFPEMPLSALRYIEPDHTLPLAEIGPALARLAESPVASSQETPMAESEKAPSPDDDFSGPSADQLGTPSAFTCPDCGGTLWERHESELVRFQCRIGHTYSPATMLAAESEMVERALWTAVRTLKESAAVNRRIAATSGVMHADFNKRAEERERYAEIIRELLLNGDFRS